MLPLADTPYDDSNPVCSKMIAGVDRVLLVGPWYSETETGGVAIATQNLVAALRRAHLDVTVLIPDGTGWRMRTHEGTHGERVIYLPVRSRHSKAAGPKAIAGYYLRLPRMRKAIRALHRQHRFEIAHFNFSTEEYGELMTEFETLGIPFIATFHGSEIAVAYDWIPLGEVTKRIVRQARCIALVSGALHKTLEAREPDLAHKFQVVHNSAPDDFWCNSAASDKPPKRDVDILYLGGLYPVKGPDVLLDAYERIRATRPETRMVIVGGGPLREPLEKRAATEDWSDCVTFAGRVPRADVLQWYRRAKVVVLPSRSEGLPLVAVEASLSGAPVVATAVGGIPEAVVHGKTGLIVPPEDPDALADALLQILGDSAFAESAGRAAEAHARSLFSPTRMAQDYIAMYNRAVADAQRSGA